MPLDTLSMVASNWNDCVKKNLKRWCHKSNLPKKYKRKKCKQISNKLIKNDVFSYLTTQMKSSPSSTVGWLSKTWRWQIEESINVVLKYWRLESSLTSSLTFYQFSVRLKHISSIRSQVLSPISVLVNIVWIFSNSMNVSFLCDCCKCNSLLIPSQQDIMNYKM